jgi:hypothetical protein
VVKILSVELKPLSPKYYETELIVTVEDSEGYANNLHVRIYGFGRKPSKRELEVGWDPEEGMDHVESECAFFLAEKILREFCT